LTKKHTDYEWFVKKFDKYFNDATCAKTEENVLVLRYSNWLTSIFYITIYARAKSSTPKIDPSA
jgi:hypothetical protein